MSAWRRYEILLPLRFNDGTAALRTYWEERSLILLNYKEGLKRKFQQLDIWLTSYSIEVL
jgi:hypothetical protein